MKRKEGQCDGGGGIDRSNLQEREEQDEATPFWHHSLECLYITVPDSSFLYHVLLHSRLWASIWNRGVCTP